MLLRSAANVDVTRLVRRRLRRRATAVLARLLTGLALLFALDRREPPRR